MIDTIKIYAEIDKETHDKIKSLSIVKSSVDNSINHLQYEIISLMSSSFFHLMLYLTI